MGNFNEFIMVRTGGAAVGAITGTSGGGVQGRRMALMMAMVALANSRESARTPSSSSARSFLLVYSSSHFRRGGRSCRCQALPLGGLLQLCIGVLNAFAQHRGGPRVREGGEFVQGGLALVDPVPVYVGKVGDTRGQP